MTYAWKDIWVTFDGVLATGVEHIPLASHIAHRLHLPLIYLRDAPKKHGTKKRYEGEINVDRYLIVGDWEKGAAFCERKLLTAVRLSR